MLTELRETLIEVYNDWVRTVEHRIETEQYFVASLYAFFGVVGAILLAGLVVTVIITLFGIIGWLLIVFVAFYLYIKEEGQRRIEQEIADEANDDDENDEPPQFV